MDCQRDPAQAEPSVGAADLLHALMAGYAVQPRVAGAENMRYEENKRNPSIKAEKTILHDGEVHYLQGVMC